MYLLFLVFETPSFWCSYSRVPRWYRWSQWMHVAFCQSFRVPSSFPAHLRAGGAPLGTLLQPFSTEFFRLWFSSARHFPKVVGHIGPGWSEVPGLLRTSTRHVLGRVFARSDPWGRSCHFLCAKDFAHFAVWCNFRGLHFWGVDFFVCGPSLSGRSSLSPR